MPAPRSWTASGVASGTAVWSTRIMLLASVIATNVIHIARVPSLTGPCSTRRRSSLAWVAVSALLRVVRVFGTADGGGGNELGVFLEGAEVAEKDRQAVAAELGFAETVFVDERERGEMRIFTPGTELPLAGHPLVGTAWLLAHEGTPVDTLRPPAGEVNVRYDGELTAVSADPTWAPHFDHIQLDSPEEVEALEGPPAGMGWVGFWAWIDEPAGIIRKRVFVPEAGIPEDEATGAAAMLQAAELGRELEIRQGRGSEIYARPLGDGRVEIAGRVAFERVTRYPDRPR
jgi:predicted PhzF superfamily epimerase YddE/YHI9